MRESFGTEIGVDVCLVVLTHGQLEKQVFVREFSDVDPGGHFVVVKAAILFFIELLL